jgi:ubiquinone/menaquinone biosynthesis C-methylase UbiE
MIDEWRAVKSAVEDALPFYESISETISFGLAGRLRRRAIRLLKGSGRGWILDSGVGPGVSSRMLIELGFQEVIGVDPSTVLLKVSTTGLGKGFHPVVGVAEYLPLRDDAVVGIITCFSLRDVRDLRKSISEFARVVQRKGRLEIVDIGKPDGPFLRQLIGVYIRRVMPIIARVSIGRRSRKNPFRMIIPTFQRLPRNSELKRLVDLGFGSSQLYEFMFGGLIILDAERRSE